MPNNDRVRAEISAIVHHIATLQRGLQEMGIDIADLREPADREAYDTVCRIERQARAGTTEEQA